MGVPVLAFVSGDRWVHSQSCSGQVFRLVGWAPTTQVLLYTSFVSFKSEPEDLREREVERMLSLQMSPWLRNPKIEERLNWERAHGRRHIALHWDPRRCGWGGIGIYAWQYDYLLSPSPRSRGNWCFLGVLPGYGRKYVHVYMCACVFFFLMLAFIILQYNSEIITIRVWRIFFFSTWMVIHCMYES